MAHITIASIRSPCVRNVSKHFQLLHTLCFGPGNQLGLFMLQILMSLASQLFVSLLVHHHSEWMSISTLCYKSFSKRKLAPQPTPTTLNNAPKNKTECKVHERQTGFIPTIMQQMINNDINQHSPPCGPNFQLHHSWYNTWRARAPPCALESFTSISFEVLNSKMK